MGFLAHRKVAMETQPVHRALNLEERFFGGIVQADRAIINEARCHRQERGGLARPRFTRKHGDHRGGEPLTAKALIDPIHPGPETLEQFEWDYDVRDGSADFVGIRELEAHG